MDNKSHKEKKQNHGFREPGTVHFGAKQIGGLFTPFIKITNHAGKTITLTADCGVETEKESKAFCEFLFDVLSNPRNPEFYGEKGREIDDTDA